MSSECQCKVGAPGTICEMHQKELLAKPPVPVGGNYFKATVKKAREAIREHAFENYQLLLTIIKQASAKGDFETAAKYTWMLLEHAAPEEGETVISESAAKPKQIEKGPGGPVIQIGVRVGGVTEPSKELPTATVIDIKPVE